MKSTTRRYVGQNIKGTPAMSAKKVNHDLTTVRDHGEAFGLQEFKWPWYWRVLHVVLLHGWSTFPGKARGLANPVKGAQGLGWNRSIWKKVQGRVELLMEGGGLTTDRYLRAVLLQDKETKLRCWHGTTHFQVDGDLPHSPHENTKRLYNNIHTLANFCHGLKRSGYPIIFELDANIHHDTHAFQILSNAVHELGGTFVGDLGVEYTIIIPGKSTKIIVVDNTIIPTSQLNTDHEGRVTHYYLVSK